MVTDNTSKFIKDIHEEMSITILEENVVEWDPYLKEFSQNMSAGTAIGSQ